MPGRRWANDVPAAAGGMASRFAPSNGSDEWLFATPDHARVLGPDRAFGERSIDHEPVVALAPVGHAGAHLERAACIVEGGAGLCKLADRVRRFGVRQLDSLQAIQRRAGGIERGPATNDEVAPPRDPGGEPSRIPLAHRRRHRRHHDRGRSGVADHLGVLHAVEERHRIGPARRLTHVPGLDGITLDQLCEMDLGFFAPAAAGRRNDGGGGNSCGGKRPAKCGEVANHPGWGTAARP